MLKITIPKSNEDWLLFAAMASLAAFSFLYMAHSLGYAQEHLNLFKGFIIGLVCAVAIVKKDHKVARKDEITFACIMAIILVGVGLSHFGIVSELTMNAILAVVVGGAISYWVIKK